MELTDEQDQVASSPAKNLVVNAFAGTGKTSTLVEYARRRPSERLLYVAFNRSVKEAAIAKFPSNVKCVTTHGLAFPLFGSLYSAKLGNPRAFHLAKALSIDIVSAGRVLETITNFLISTDDNITEYHAMPALPKANMSDIYNLMDFAESAWRMMKDVANSAVPMPHDGYLKLYQLSRPQIHTGIILFDEAQDANPVTLDIVSKQNANKVFVGDRYQAIYGFRGAVDALKSIQADESLLLSTSFRFGKGISDLATALLHDWRDCKIQVHGKCQYQTVFNVNKGQPHAVISRTNGRLFAEAVALVHSDKPFGFAGGVEGYRFDQILDTYNLFCGKRDRVRDHFIASFENFAQMRQYGEELIDREVKALVSVVNDYRHEIPGLIDEIKRRATPSLTGQEVALSTAHKAKGLEFMDVVLTDDYVTLKEKRDNATGEIEIPSAEEINVLYVAATRAMRGICLPPSVCDWLAETGRHELLPTKNTKTGESYSAIKSSSDAGTISEETLEIARRFKQIDVDLKELRLRINTFTPGKSEAIAKYLHSEADKFSITQQSRVNAA